MFSPDDGVHEELLALSKAEPVDLDTVRYPASGSADGPPIAGRRGRVAYREVAMRSMPSPASSLPLRRLAKDSAVVAVGERDASGLVPVRTDDGHEGLVNWLEIQWEQATATSAPARRRTDRPFVETPIAETPTPSDFIILDSINNSTNRLQPNELSRFTIVRGQSPTEVLHRAIATALLANEQAGNIELRVTEFTRFGFIRKSRLESRVIDRKLRWPAFSFESWFTHSGAIEDQVYDFIGETSASPENELRKRTMIRMADRGLLERRLERQRLLRIFSYMRERFVLPAATSQLMTTHARLTATGYLARFEQSRPVMCGLMFESIKSAFSRRTQTSD